MGEGIRRSGIPRAEVFLTTKFNRDWHSRDGVRTAFGPGSPPAGRGLPRPVPGPLAQPRAGAVRRGLRRPAATGPRTGPSAPGESPTSSPPTCEQVRAAGLERAAQPGPARPGARPARHSWHTTATHGILTAAYSPLGRNGGFLADPAITGPAAELGQTPAQIVLRWHVQQGRVAVPKSASDARQRRKP